MIALFQALPQEIEFEGARMRVDLMFDTVLACLEAMRDPQLPEHLRAPVVFAKLVPEGKKVPPAAQAKIVAVVFDKLICFQKQPQAAKKQPRAFDFTQDADLIFAAFRQAYGMDLLEQQGKLHWWKFISLFAALPQDTKMREVMNIRTRPVPQPTKHNAKEIQSLLELKQAYALRQEPVEDTYADGLQALWTVLERQAVKR